MSTASSASGCGGKDAFLHIFVLNFLVLNAAVKFMHGDLTRIGSYLEGAGFPVPGNIIEKAIHCRLGAKLRMQALGAPNLEAFSGHPAVQPPHFRLIYGFTSKSSIPAEDLVDTRRKRSRHCCCHCHNRIAGIESRQTQTPSP